MTATYKVVNHTLRRIASRGCDELGKAVEHAETRAAIRGHEYRIYRSAGERHTLVARVVAELDHEALQFVTTLIMA